MIDVEEIPQIINVALTRVEMEIAGNAASGEVYAKGLSAEGYAGGYADALRDMQLVVRGQQACRRPGYWRHQ